LPQPGKPKAMNSSKVSAECFSRNLTSAIGNVLRAPMVLSIGSVSPDYPFLEFGVGALHACLKRFPDDTKFWVDYGVGKKFCGWIEGIISANGSKVLDDDMGVRAPVEEIVSNLIRLGVVQAANLENALSR
jgi:hypothetical protein